jgi:histone-lysine N-methyltransferase SETMAR
MLLCDNARPQTVETVNEVGFELMEHPPYSPDLTPRDFRMFDPMKEALRGRGISSDEVIGPVQNWLKTQQKKLFFSDGIKKLVKRWNQ